MRGLPDEVREVDAELEDGPGLGGREEHVWVHDHGADRAGHRNLLHARVIDADREHEPAEQGRRDVVGVPCTACHRLPGHGELEQLEAAHGLRQQRVRRNHRADRGSGRAPEPGADRDALVDLQAEAEGGTHRFLQRKQRTTCGVVAHLMRQLSPAHGVDLDTGRGTPRHGDAIAERVDRKTENVEADRDIADRGGGKGRSALPGRAAHSRAPRYAARRSRSANTPPAVTSGPAPGPCTMSGLSR